MVALGAKEQWLSVIKGKEEGIPFYLARRFEVRGEHLAHGSRPEEGIVSLPLRREIGDRS